MSPQISGKQAGVTRLTEGLPGLFRVFWRTTFSAATQSSIPIQQAGFSISVCCRISSMTYGGLWTADKLGQTSLPRTAAINNGSQLTTPTAADTDFNISRGVRAVTITAGDSLPGRQTVASAGSTRSTFLTHRLGERSMSIPTAIYFWAG